MKKLLVLILVAFVAIAANSQIVGQSVAFVADSTTDVQTKYLAVANAVAIQGDYIVGLTITPTNKSGTATVVAALEFSNDNSVWHNYGSSTTVNTAGTVGNWSWIVPEFPFRYVRIKCTSSGSGVTILNGKLALKRKQ